MQECASRVPCRSRCRWVFPATSALLETLSCPGAPRPQPVLPAWTPLTRGRRGCPGPPPPRAGGLRTRSPARTRMMLFLPLDLLLPDHTDLSREEVRSTPRTGDKPGPGGSPGPHTLSCHLHLGVNVARPLTPQPAPARGRPTRHNPPPHTPGGDTGLPRGSQRRLGWDWVALDLPVTFGSSGQMTRCVCGCSLGTSGRTGGHAALRGLRPGQLGRGFSRMRCLVTGFRVLLGSTVGDGTSLPGVSILGVPAQTLAPQGPQGC